MSAIGAIIAPFFIGMIADRFFSAQKILGILNILGSLLLLAGASMAVNASGQPQFAVFRWIMLAHFLCYMPTWALTNTIALNQMSNPAKQFPGIRVIGTLGWVAVSMITLFGPQINKWLELTVKFEATKTPMYIGAAIGMVAGILSFIMPSTPPKSLGHKITASDILGLKALSLFKDRNFLIFALCSFLILFPNMYYWAFANLYLNESGMNNAMAWQSSGQMSETIFLIIMPLFFARFGVKVMLLIGMCSWMVRFVCFSFGIWTNPVLWILVFVGLLLHGPCYDFFFVTGQLYTNKKAPKEIQAQAQGLISLITFGLGWFVGSNTAGWVVEYFAIKAPKLIEGKTVMFEGKIVEVVTGHHWSKIWLCPIGMAFIILVIFLIFFRDNMQVGHDEAEKSLEKAEEQEII
ncbi:MAG: MFS transporter, partial [Candidatus Sumerlaeota bacterium]|nr:MFS transporter [Candidatus Sumerlaeota bacterium]